MTGFDHICGIQDTEKYKYYEFTKYIGTIIFLELSVVSSMNIYYNI